MVLYEVLKKGDKSPKNKPGTHFKDYMIIKQTILLAIVCFYATLSASAQDPADLAETARIPAYGITNMPKAPQEPKPYKNYSDLTAAGLRGKVKTVALYKECNAGQTKNLQLKERKHYSPQGDLLKTFAFETHYTCDPAKLNLVAISAWGYRGTERIEGRYSIRTIFTKAERGEFRHVYTFDGKNRLMDEKIYSPNGSLYEHLKYRYGDKKIDLDRLIVGLQAEPFPYVFFLDGKGNIVKEIDGPTREHTFGKLDAKGNWLDRTTQVKAPAGNVVGVDVFQRLIEYYP
jgi:hypothetical protein